MPSNVLEYCTPHDRLTKELVIPGKLIQRRHNMCHKVHAVQSYFWASPLETDLRHSNQLPINISCIRIQPKIWIPVSFYLYSFQTTLFAHLWPEKRCKRLSHINSWYDIYPWRHSNLKLWRLSKKTTRWQPRDKLPAASATSSILSLASIIELVSSSVKATSVSTKPVSY